MGGCQSIASALEVLFGAGQPLARGRHSDDPQKLDSNNFFLFFRPASFQEKTTHAGLPGCFLVIVVLSNASWTRRAGRPERSGSSLQTNDVCGLPAGCSLRAAGTAIQGARISVSSPLLDGYDEPEILRSSSR
jgi:hypothetical protein